MEQLKSVLAVDNGQAWKLTLWLSASMLCAALMWPSDKRLTLRTKQNVHRLHSIEVESRLGPLEDHARRSVRGIELLLRCVETSGLVDNADADTRVRLARFNAASTTTSTASDALGHP
eukprot:4751827-Prymnesium_polylepis.2